MVREVGWDKSIYFQAFRNAQRVSDMQASPSLHFTSGHALGVTDVHFLLRPRCSAWSADGQEAPEPTPDPTGLTTEHLTVGEVGEVCIHSFLSNNMWVRVFFLGSLDTMEKARKSILPPQTLLDWWEICSTLCLLPQMGTGEQSSSWYVSAPSWCSEWDGKGNFLLSQVRKIAPKYQRMTMCRDVRAGP